MNEPMLCDVCAKRRFGAPLPRGLSAKYFVQKCDGCGVQDYCMPYRDTPPTPRPPETTMTRPRRTYRDEHLGPGPDQTDAQSSGPFPDPPQIDPARPVIGVPRSSPPTPGPLPVVNVGIEPPKPCLVGRYSLQENAMAQEPSPSVKPGSYPEEFVTRHPYSTWEHRKGGLYIVFGIATCSTNGERDGVERSVVYMSMKYGHIRYREVSEFLDGRFIYLDGEGNQVLPPLPEASTEKAETPGEGEERGPIFTDPPAPPG